jgi:hypothetical protein
MAQRARTRGDARAKVGTGPPDHIAVDTPSTPLYTAPTRFEEGLRIAPPLPRSTPMKPVHSWPSTAPSSTADFLMHIRFLLRPQTLARI